MKHPAPAVQVCDDIRSILKIEGCETFRSSVDRPNLAYEVGASRLAWLG
jgi:superfamily II DNA helicase RecQ